MIGLPWYGVRAECPYSCRPNELAELRRRVVRLRNEVASVRARARALGWDLSKEVPRG